jgi:hypothetical protein
MGMAWNDPWNGLTTTTALMIDNNQNELETVVGMARGEMERSGDTPACRVDLADKLKNRYGTRTERIANANSSNFDRALSGALLNECIGEINWFGLAEHYMQQVRERLAKEAKAGQDA